MNAYDAIDMNDFRMRYAENFINLWESDKDGVTVEGFQEAIDEYMKHVSDEGFSADTDFWAFAAAFSASRHDIMRTAMEIAAFMFTLADFGC